MRAHKEEIFGPVLACVRLKDFAEALQLEWITGINDPLILVVREGLEPAARSCVISKLLIYISHLPPAIPSNPRIRHSIWHWNSPSTTRVAASAL
jgi:hypothetical protein